MAESSFAVDVQNLETEDHPVCHFKASLAAHYKKLQGIHQYQIFHVSPEEKGFVHCR